VATENVQRVEGWGVATENVQRAEGEVWRLKMYSV
jgi:hypothetical protein